MELKRRRDPVLTDTEDAVLDFLTERYLDNNLPSLQDIRKEFGWDARGTAWRVLKSLEYKGWVKHTPKVARGWRPIVETCDTFVEVRTGQAVSVGGIRVECETGTAVLKITHPQLQGVMTEVT